MKAARVTTIAVALGALVAGALQIASFGALGGSAERASVPGLIAATLGDRGTRAFVDAGALWLAPIAVQSAIARRDFGSAATFLARMPAGARRDALSGDLLLARGDESAAQRAYMRAGDVVAVEREVAALHARDDYRAARALQRRLVERLAQTGENRDVRADALWHLGQLDAEVGYREPPRRRTEWLRAYGEYREALVLVPLSVTIWLAAGNQALLDGDRVAALQSFEAALRIDPASGAAREGLMRARSNVPLRAFHAPGE